MGTDSPFRRTAEPSGTGCRARSPAYKVEETARGLPGTTLDPADIAALSHVLRTGGELLLKKKSRQSCEGREITSW